MLNLLKCAKHIPPVRDEVTLYPVVGDLIVMILDEVDVGDRKSNVLIAMCERKNKARFVTSDAAKLARGVYNTVGSQILRIRGPGGGALVGQVPMRASGETSTGSEPPAVASARSETTAVDVRASGNEDESMRSGGPLASAAERKVRTKEIRDQLARENSIFQERSVATKKEIDKDNAAEASTR
jgi:hypothetical protein